MKRVLAICFVLTSLLTNAQVTHHFPHNNASWGQFDGLWGAGVSGSTTMLYANGDSLINGKSYIKINNGTRLIREDSLGKVWYFSNDTIDLLLYDFSANVGDTVYCHNIGWSMPVGYVVIDSVYYTELKNAELRKTFYVREYGGGFLNWEPLIWIEGIGSNAGLFYPGSAEINDGITWLQCFTENDTLKYGDSCNLVLDISRNESPTTFEPHPNPNNGNFIVNYNHQGIDRLELTITNLLGQTAYMQQLDATKSSEQIELNDVPTGIYMLCLRSGNAVHNTKLLIQR